MQTGEIEGVVLQQLVRYADDRGYFKEIIRGTICTLVKVSAD